MSIAPEVPPQQGPTNPKIRFTKGIESEPSNRYEKLQFKVQLLDNTSLRSVYRSTAGNASINTHDANANMGAVTTSTDDATSSVDDANATTGDASGSIRDTDIMLIDACAILNDVNGSMDDANRTVDDAYCTLDCAHANLELSSCTQFVVWKEK
ncbi:unnamed protein product, partial [Rotaria socialis]